jgi:hypothetical protein
MEDLLLEPKPRRTRRTIIMALAGAFIGWPVGWFVGRLVKSHRVPDLQWGDLGALMIAVALMGLGLIVLALTANRRGRAILASPDAPEFDRAVGPDQTTFFRLQAAVLLLAGAMLVAPVVFGWADSSAQRAFARPAMAAVVVVFVLQTVCNVLIWQRADEVFRQVIAETGAFSFWLLQGLYFLWAVGVKFGVFPEVSSWNAVTILMGAYLMVSAVVAWRRGLG